MKSAIDMCATLQWAIVPARCRPRGLGKPRIFKEVITAENILGKSRRDLVIRQITCRLLFFVLYRQVDALAIKLLAVKTR